VAPELRWIERVLDGDVLVVRVVGAHDVATAHTLQFAIEQALQERGAVVIDLSETMSLDAATVSVIARAHTAASGGGGRLVLQLTPNPPAGLVRVTTLLVETLPHARSRDEAIKLASGRTGHAPSELSTDPPER
jgi:anti-anti-sigma factor